MQRDELLVLRDLVEMEKKRRESIYELLNEELIKEYLRLSRTDPVKLDPNDLREIISMYIKKLEFSKSNGIYVCTNAYNLESRVCYEETDYYHDEVDIDSRDAEFKIYGDIETGNFIKARNRKNTDRLIPNIIDEFEESNIVLNPTNSHINMNNYKDVQLDFFEKAVTDGQGKSKQLLLKKYKRL